MCICGEWRHRYQSEGLSEGASAVACYVNRAMEVRMGWALLDVAAAAV